MSSLLARFGPGMMLAAASVGVSHLVFSTQAGANYGLSLIWFVGLIVLLKYPAFRFAVLYAGATGDSLVNGYAKISKLALAWLLIGFFVDMFIATSAVAMLTAGLLIEVLNLSVPTPFVAVGITVATGLVLANGVYSKAEGIVKVLVLAFSVLAVVTMLFALPLLGADDRPIFAELTASRSLGVFMIAVAGWMPIPTNAAVLVAEWVREKHVATKGAFEVREAFFDFHISYALTLVIAVCFIVMGTAVLFDTGRAVPQAAPAFAHELFGVFTQLIGDWTFPIIAATAIAVVWSTQVALMDAMPRVMSRLTATILGKAEVSPYGYSMFLVVQVIGVTLIVLLLLQSFATFIVFATSMGFVAAPAIAWYNYKAVTSPAVPDDLKPSQGMIIWNSVAVIVMTAFAVAFFYTLVTA